MGLFGEGVIVGIADSGIDYTNSVFRNQDGSTRILRLWDQVTDTVYSESDINQALMLENSYTKVNSRDLTGHGTHVAELLLEILQTIKIIILELQQKANW